MKKLIAIALLAFASSAVFAGEPSPAVHSNNTVSVIDASTSAADAPVTAPTALEKGATKVGSVLGSMLRSTVKLGQAVGKGVREGLADDRAKSTDVRSTSQTDTPSAQKAMPPALASMFSNPLTNRLTALVKRDKDEPAAPVDDYSTIASNSN